VALTYAVMAVSCVVAPAWVAMLIWQPGSWADLWRYIRTDHEYHYWLGTSLVLWVLALLSFRYSALGRTWRRITLGISACIALWRFGDTVWLTLTKVVPSISVLIGRWLLTSVFVLCTYTLWQSARASNNRWRGP
jgi:hypothetical protein